MVRKAHQQLRLRKFDMNTSILTNFYRCTINSLRTGCITVWNRNCSSPSRKILQGMVQTAQNITGRSLPSTQGIYRSWCPQKARSIIEGHSHPAHRPFCLLPSVRRYRSLTECTKKLKVFNSQIPKLSIKLLKATATKFTFVHL